MKYLEKVLIRTVKAPGKIPCFLSQDSYSDRKVVNKFKNKLVPKDR